MNFKVLNRLIAFIFLIFVSQVQAQTPVSSSKGLISGKLVDAGSGQPLEFATLSLIKKGTTLPGKSVQTDLQGSFKFTDVAEGTYQLRATYVGYATVTKDSLLISQSNQQIALGLVKMTQTKGVLKEVTIRAPRSTIQLGTDKKVFSVDQSLVSQGGSATDLLSNVPSVQVDVDGNLNLRGSSNVRVLINGKPSALTGGNVADILQSIPASSIENIEVITNPSSKYDAEGQSGIINIVLKKNARVGFNGNVTGSVGTQSSKNANVNLAYQNQSVNIYGNYGFRKANRGGNGYTNKTIFDAVNGNSYQNQIANQSFDFSGQNVRAGIDVNLDKKTTLSLSGNGNFRSRNRFQYGDTRTTNSAGKLTQLTSQNSQSLNTGGNHNYDVALDFDKKFKTPQQSWTATVAYSEGRENNTDFQDIGTNYYLYTPVRSSRHIQQNLNDGYNRNLNIQTDLLLPLSKNNKIETGYRSTFSRNESNNNVDSLTTGQVFIPDPNLTNHFLYNEQIHAVYANYQQQFGKFGVQGGVRVEEARINTLLKDNGTSNVQNYLRVYPSLFLSDKISENQTLQISYSRRVSRPRDMQISPFLDKSDPFNYRQGTPTLKPEDTHSFELSYINYWKTLTLTSSIYHRITNDNIQQIRTPLDTAITILRFQNIAQATNSGFELIAKVNATDKLDVTANVNVYYRHLTGDARYNLPTTSGYAWNGNLTANFKPMPKLGIQLRGDYQAPQVITQGHMRAMAGLDGGAKYDVTKKFNISFNVRDVFNSRKFGSIIDNNGAFPYHSESVRRFQSRVMQISVAYRFGSSPEQKRDKKKQGQQDGDSPSPDEGGGGGGGTPPAGGAQPFLKQ